MRDVKKLGLLVQCRGCRLRLQCEERGDGDGENADETADEGGAFEVDAVLYRVAQNRQRQAAQGYGEDTRPGYQSGSQHHHEGVKRGNRNAQGRERINDENRSGERDGDERYEVRFGGQRERHLAVFQTQQSHCSRTRCLI